MKTTCKTSCVRVGASAGGRLRLHSHQEIPTTDPLFEMFCQGLLYMLAGDWFVCTCMCWGAHTSVIHIHRDQKRTSDPALPFSYSLQIKFFSESAGTCHFLLGLACQQTHAPPASSTPEPCARVRGTGIHSQSLCRCFGGFSGFCSYPLSHLPSLSVTS